MRESVNFEITLALGAAPEDMAATSTIALAISLQRMAVHCTVVRKLPSVGTLFRTTGICSNKTGILRRNEMTLRLLQLPGPSM